MYVCAQVLAVDLHAVVLVSLHQPGVVMYVGSVAVDHLPTRVVVDFCHSWVQVDVCPEVVMMHIRMGMRLGVVLHCHSGVVVVMRFVGVGVVQVGLHCTGVVVNLCPQVVVDLLGCSWVVMHLCYRVVLQQPLSI